MNVKTLTRLIDNCVRTKKSLYIWGLPGVGKSQIVRDYASSHNISLIDIRTSLLDPIDLRGLPKITKGEVVWYPPSFLPRTGKGILLLDELNLGSPATLSACYQLVLDRHLGEYILPEGWSIIATGNPTGRGTTPLSVALKSRFVHATLETSITDWLEWAAVNKIHPEVLYYLQSHRESYYPVQPKEAPYSYPCPRTWETLSTMIRADNTVSTCLDIVAGVIGEVESLSFVQWVRSRDTLPTLHDIISNPGGCRIPITPDGITEVIKMVSGAVSTSNISSILSYGDRLSPEYRVKLVKDCCRCNPDIGKTPEFLGWVSRNTDILG